MELYMEILNETNNLDTSKSTQSEDIPFKTIKDNAGILTPLLSCKTLMQPMQHRRKVT